MGLGAKDAAEHPVEDRQPHPRGLWRASRGTWGGAMAQHHVDFVLQPELGRWVGEATEWVLGSVVKHLLSVAVTRHHSGSDFSALEILKSEARSLECGVRPGIGRWRHS